MQTDDTQQASRFTEAQRELIAKSAGFLADRIRRPLRLTTGTADSREWARIAPGARWLALDSSRGRLKVPGLRLVDGRRVVAARLIVGAGPFDRMTYRNGQAFDLRRGNLLVAEGAARVSQAVGREKGRPS